MANVKRSVLIVENEPLVREAMEEILNTGGLKTLTAASGKDSITTFIALQHEIDMVILDMRMPGMDGPEVFNHLRGIAPNLKALVVSGSVEQDIRSEFINEQPTSILVKPFDAETLLAKVYQVLGGQT